LRFEVRPGKQLARPYLKKKKKKPLKKGLVEWLRVIGPEFKPQYWGGKKERKKKLRL
jgi:hypothetical protein